MNALLLILILMVALFIGIPIFHALMIASSVYVLFLSDLPITLLAHRMSGSLQKFPLLALPLYILAAELMNQGKISEEIFRFAKRLLGDFQKRYHMQ